MASDWMMPEAVYDWLARRLGPCDVVVELGSGDGTQLLANLCGHVYSVEHNIDYVMPDTDKVTGIFATIVDDWYDPDEVFKSLPASYTCVVVDGPPWEVGRGGLLENLELFADVPFLFDDTHRKPEMELACAVADIRGKDISIHCLRGGRSFATVGWENR